MFFGVIIRNENVAQQSLDIVFFFVLLAVFQLILESLSYYINNKQLLSLKFYKIFYSNIIVVIFFTINNQIKMLTLFFSLNNYCFLL